MEVVNASFLSPGTLVVEFGNSVDKGHDPIVSSPAGFGSAKKESLKSTFKLTLIFDKEVS